jgi:hypothetical protein
LARSAGAEQRGLAIACRAQHGADFDAANGLHDHALTAAQRQRLRRRENADGAPLAVADHELIAGGGKSNGGNRERRAHVRPSVSRMI